MPPCHGGDRRFESGQARQVDIHSYLLYYSLMPSDKDPSHLRPSLPNTETTRRLARLIELMRGVEVEPSNRLLYIEPSAQTSEEPLIDETTQKMTAALRMATVSERWRGIHRCACGVHSDNCDYALPSGHETNSLAIHYLALHREEIPTEHLEIVDGFDYGLGEPTFDELRIVDSTK
jgi:hypothetical protein